MEQNKALIRRFYEEVWDKGNVNVADEVLPLTMMGMTCVRAIRSRDRRGRNRLPPFRAAFPDLHFTLGLLVAEADMVVGRWTATGTNTGLWGNIPPTGKIAKFSAVNIFGIANGKAVEIWNHQDDLGLATRRPDLEREPSLKRVCAGS